MQLAAGQTAAGNLIEFVFFPLLVVVLASALTAAAVALRRFSREWGQLAKDLRGEPARPGVDARPGVMERLKDNDGALSGVRGQLEGMQEQIDVIHHEMKPNGGWSMKDQVNRMDPLYRAPTAPLEDPAAAS